MILPADHVDALAFIEFIFNHSPSLAGEALFWADLDDYYCGTSCLDTTLRLLNAAPRTRDAHRDLLSRLFDECGEPYDETRLPGKVTDNILSGAAHIAAVRAYVEANHPIISSWKRARQGRGLDAAAAAAAEVLLRAAQEGDTRNERRWQPPRSKAPSGQASAPCLR